MYPGQYSKQWQYCIAVSFRCEVVTRSPPRYSRAPMRTFYRCVLKGTVRLYDLALTQEQIDLYHLPCTPVKATEKRKDVWEAVHGVDAIDLNALGNRLPAIVDAALAHYYDFGLEQRVQLAHGTLKEKLETLEQHIYSVYPELEALRMENEDIV